MVELSDEDMKILLDQQNVEFRSQFAIPSTEIARTVAETPESVLFATGNRLIRSSDVSERILAVRLIREIRYDHYGVNRLIDSMLRTESDSDVLYWLVSSYAFQNSDQVTDRLIEFVSSTNPGIRYHVATALANSSGALDERSSEALITLSRDENSEVRFSAVFEIGTLWQSDRYPQFKSTLETALTDSEESVASTARQILKK